MRSLLPLFVLVTAARCSFAVKFIITHFYLRTRELASTRVIVIALSRRTQPQQSATPLMRVCRVCVCVAPLHYSTHTAHTVVGVDKCHSIYSMCVRRPRARSDKRRRRASRASAHAATSVSTFCSQHRAATAAGSGRLLLDARIASHTYCRVLCVGCVCRNVAGVRMCVYMCSGILFFHMLACTCLST